MPSTVLADRRRRVCQTFPGRTETDRYLWLMRRRDDLYDRYRRTREPDASTAEHVDAMAAALDPRTKALAPLRRLTRRRSAPTRPRSSAAVPRPKPAS